MLFLFITASLVCAALVLCACGVAHSANSPIMNTADSFLPAILISGAMPTEDLNRNPRLQVEALLLKPYTLGTLCC